MNLRPQLIGFRKNGLPIFLIAGGSESTIDSSVTQDSPSNDPGTGAVEPEPNKAPWASELESLPESVRPLVEPIFKDWEGKTTQKFQQVHSQYEPYKAFEPFIQQGIDPAQLNQAWQLAAALNEDPEGVYKLLGETYGFVNSEQGQGGNQGQQQLENPDEQYDPRFLQLEQTTNTLADIMVAQQQAQEAAALDQQLDAELTAAREKHGDFDETVVLGWMSADPSLTAEKAAERYNQAIEAALKSRQAPHAPTVLGGGGSVPSQVIDPAKLTGKDTKSLVAQWLENANRDQ